MRLIGRHCQGNPALEFQPYGKGAPGEGLGGHCRASKLSIKSFARVCASSWAELAFLGGALPES